MPRDQLKGTETPPSTPLSSKLSGLVQGLSPRSFRDRNMGSPDTQLNRAMAQLHMRPPKLSAEEQAVISDPKVSRLAKVTQMYFLDNYFDLLNYIKARRLRHDKFHNETLANLDRADQKTALHKYLGRERAQLRKRRTKLNYGDFDVLTQVGQGGYGQVYLAKKRDTKEICALKVLNKRLLVKLDEIQHILTERDILAQAAKSDWLVRLLYSFQDTEKLYLAMEFVPGGDFRTLLNNTGTLNSRHTRFYMAEMFSALDALHQLNFIHRDLKPENFLISANGHIKLTDFGLASGQISAARIESLKRRLDRAKDMSSQPYMSVKDRTALYRTARQTELDYANSIVGSPDYMALEVLEGASYDYTIDYWSMGCMLFEALVGYPPFAGRTSDETYANLQKWRQTLRRPRYEDGGEVMSNRTWVFITRLITSPRLRLRSFNEIKGQDYFAEFAFEDLRSMRPPFIPDLEGEDDAGYFDDFDNQADMEKYKEVLNKRAQVESMADKGGLHSRDFIGFTFKHAPSELREVDATGETFATIL